MREYSAWQAIYMSFYSRKLYRDVATNWGGFTFLYLLLVLALSWVYCTYQLQHSLNQFYVKASDQVVTQIPVMNIQNGKLITPEKRPYIIRDPGTNETIAVIDTTGKYKTLADAKTGLLITDTEVISQPKPTQTRIDQIPTNVTFTLDPVVINQYVKGSVGYAWVLMFPVLVLLSFFGRVIQAIIYGVIGKLFSAMTHAGISYAQSLQLSIVAVTPAIILSTLADAFNIPIVTPGLLFFAIAMFYLFIGVHANKR